MIKGVNEEMSQTKRVINQPISPVESRDTNRDAPEKSRNADCAFAYVGERAAYHRELIEPCEY